MKKIASLFITCLSVVCLASCGGAEQSSSNEHEFGAWVEEIPSTCLETGVKGHYVCEDCGLNFDKDGNQINDLVIPLGEHHFGEYVPEDPSTCISHGTKGYYYCDVCEKFFDNDNNEIEDLTLDYGDHVYGSLIEEQPSSCCEHGRAEHYECEVCHELFNSNKEMVEETDLELPFASHSGLHYSAKAPGFTVPGYLECWYCSSCNEYFLDRPTSGSWTEASEDLVVDETMPQYIPSTIGTYLAEAIVDAYDTRNFYESQGTYEYEIYLSKKNLLDVDEILVAASDTFKTNATLHEANEELLAQDIANWRTAIIEAYGRDIPRQVHDAFIGTFKPLTLGVFAHEGSNFIECVGDIGYATYIYDDPTMGDNRWWVPECYRAPKIYEYAQSLVTVYNNKEDIFNAITLLMKDVALSAGQAIAEAENYYAMNQNGHLTVDGNPTATAWWFVWAYESSHFTFTYVGTIPLYAEATYEEFRLSKVCSYEIDGSRTWDYATVCQMYNWLIAHQVDDMFAPKK